MPGWSAWPSTSHFSMTPTQPVSIGHYCRRDSTRHR
ncbi:hypothetical protein Goshw_016655 [Gossypium schwendimanii]|uniref:Uncharacterized protein n=1 Tax=Gossypium schwendimanii TaxID=34291 RepID=A0A7J9LGA2_GOSSC|nr:hypothetical protein [Gossypium schwendimanii]